MKRLGKTVLILTSGLAATALTRLVMAKRTRSDDNTDQAFRWSIVTVNLPLDRVQDLIETMPVNTLGELAQTRLRASGLGTEIAVRLRAAGLTDPDTDIAQLLGTMRQALNSTKSQLEAEAH